MLLSDSTETGTQVAAERSSFERYRFLIDSDPVSLHSRCTYGNNRYFLTTKLLTTLSHQSRLNILNLDHVATFPKYGEPTDEHSENRYRFH